MWWALLLAACGSPSRGGGDGDGGAQDSGPSAKCPAGSETTIVGTLFAPNGKDPVPNATVYVPSGAPAPFPDGVACDLCGMVSGARVQATTGPDGTFALPGAPDGEVTLVAELGRFRSVRTMRVAPCAQNVVPADPGVAGLRLPGKDGDLAPGDRVPKIAVATGDFDQIECVLKRMGLQSIDLYDDRTGATLPKTIATFESLVSDLAKMKQYHIIFVNCTAAQHFEPTLQKPGVLANLEAYVAAGGRLYATDWAYDVIHQVPEFAPMMCFIEDGVLGPAPPATCAGKPAPPGAAHSDTAWHTSATILDSTMAAWLANFPSTIAKGQVPVAFNFVVINKVQGDTKVYAEGNAEAQGSTPMLAKGTRPLTVTFDYKQCGRVHYSTYNTEPSNVVANTAATRYPGCDNRDTFNAQERLLEYLVFQTAQCIPPIL